MQLSIIIVNWNVKNLIKKSILSILNKIKNLNFEIIVIDNNSRDGSKEMLLELQKQYIKLKIIFNNENKGFAKANNQGLKIANGKYILFLNPDTEIKESNFKKIFDYMEANSKVGACTARLFYNNKKQQPNVKKDPTLLSQLLILLKFHHFIKTKALKKYLAKDFDYSKKAEVKQIMGAFIFTRKSLMEELKGWSEDYFVWWEDLDLCQRIRKAGKKIIYLPIGYIIHYEGKSFAQQFSYKKQKIFNKGMITYWKKFYPLWQTIILEMFCPLSLFLSFCVQLLKTKPRSQSKI
ncbi:MAG: glycosyltransferase [Xanthomonadaceae bacterium]|nr:glycosyltransferase [Rhodospirillaceae bacterium]NIA18101.1 glycosyltransferase [Xanthomonadaceae bacterium]